MHDADDIALMLAIGCLVDAAGHALLAAHHDLQALEAPSADDPGHGDYSTSDKDLPAVAGRLVSEPSELRTQRHVLQDALWVAQNPPTTPMRTRRELAGTPSNTAAASLYANTSSLNDVTSGSDGSCSPSYLCTAGSGYDGPTGLGTPNGLGAFNGTGGGIGGTGGGGGATGQVSSGMSGKCLDDYAASNADGTKADLYPCNGTGAQQWTVESNGTLQINGKCLDITGASTSDGALIELWDCNNGGNQVWQPQSNGELLNPVSGKCLDDPGSAPPTAPNWICGTATAASTNTGPFLSRQPRRAAAPTPRRSWHCSASCRRSR